MPSMVAAIRGASYVLITDYPDKELIDNIKHNVAENLPSVVYILGIFWWISQEREY